MGLETCCWTCFSCFSCCSCCCCRCCCEKKISGGLLGAWKLDVDLEIWGVAAGAGVPVGEAYDDWFGGCP